MRVMFGFLGVVALIVLAVTVALAVLYSQVSRYARYWDWQNQTSLQKDALVYVALGDSTAQGIGATQPQRGYVGLLAESLQQKYQRPVQVINLSKTGARLEDCLEEQLPKLAQLPEQPDVVTIEIGANNMSNFEAASFRQQMDQVMQQLPKHTIISDMPKFDVFGGRFRSLEGNVVTANKIITELAEKHSLRLAPLHDVTERQHTIFTLAVDLFHPSNLGYKNWHDAFWSVLADDSSDILTGK